MKDNSSIHFMAVSNKLLAVAAYVEERAKGVGMGVYLALMKVALDEGDEKMSLMQAFEETGITSGSQRTAVTQYIREAYRLMDTDTGIPPELTPHDVYLDNIMEEKR